MGNDAATLGRRFFEDVLDKGDWDAAKEIIAGDIIMHHPSSPEPILGFEAVKGMLLAFRAGFPDLKMSVLDAFGTGDKAAVRWQMEGTQTAELFGIPPTGKHVIVNGMSMVRAERRQDR